MLRDRVVIWVAEYIFGAVLVVVPLTALGLWGPGRMDAYILAVGLFVICLGVILISCASSMRQRMHLAKRIEILAEEIGKKAVASLQQSATTESRADENR